MELSGTVMNVILVILIVILLAANIYFRRRKEEKTPLGKVIRILYEVGHNQRTIESFEFHQGRKKFKTGGWKRNKNKVDFLPSELLATLSKAFEMAEEFTNPVQSGNTYYINDPVWKGGKFCWDCHDPHGDTNIYMIQDEVATETDGTVGIPVTTRSVSFTKN